MIDMRRFNAKFRVAVVLVAGLMSVAAYADVVVDMPVPRKKVVVDDAVAPYATTAPAKATAEKEQEDVGSLALYRYSSARAGTTNTYWYGGSSWRNNNWNNGWWSGWGWGWGWPGWGCGNRFVGWVGHPPRCGSMKCGSSMRCK